MTMTDWVHAGQVSGEHARCRVYSYWRSMGFTAEEARRKVAAFEANRRAHARQVAA